MTTDKERKAWVNADWRNYLSVGSFPTENNTGEWGELLAKSRREWRADVDAAMAAEAEHPKAIYAVGRKESEDCEKLTPGCSVNHTATDDQRPGFESSCETW